MKFYDTSSLLLKANSLFTDNIPFAISSITLKELEEIKTSSNKDPNIKYAARHILHILDEHDGEYEISIYKESMLQKIIEKDLPITNDMKILASALNYDVFVTNDLALKKIAQIFFPSNCIESVNEDFNDNYTGYLEVMMDDKEMEHFYSNLNENIFNVLTNQYIIIKDINNNIVDRRVWTGEIYRNINFENFYSSEIGQIRPMSGDI